METFTYGAKCALGGRDFIASDYLRFFASTIEIMTFPDAMPLFRSKTGFLFLNVFSTFA